MRCEGILRAWRGGNLMVDYYSILSRAVTAPGAGDAQWRRSTYDRARQMLVSQLRARQPPVSAAEIAAEQAALDGAIRRIEQEFAQSGNDPGAFDEPLDDQGDMTDTVWVEPRRGPIARPFRLSAASWIVLAVIVAAIVGGAAMWTMMRQHPAAAPVTAQRPASAPAPTSKTEAAATQPVPQPVRTAIPAAEKDGDLAPGIDGGSSDTDLPYVFRRQPVFYRTLQPPGTIIVDKLQHFLYLTQKNNVALRYGIGIGASCTDLAGLHRIASKAEWPPWEPTPDMIQRRLAKSGTLAGGPGNPLGARLLQLDDGQSRINGTNAPKTIGTTVIFGCMRLVNDDAVDLYNRVQVSTPVIVSD
jgi:lipoprotein-anchoring transpeptidase ErfK/SrfK